MNTLLALWLMTRSWSKGSLKRLELAQSCGMQQMSFYWSLA